MSDALRFWSTTQLREPAVVLAFAGWNDGGEAATGAVSYLLETLAATRLASLDLEDFVDFTVVRPHVRLREDDRREIIWPASEFYGIEAPSQEFDLVLGLGVEPHLRWKTYCRTVVDLVQQVGASRVILLGAFLDEVIYSQPIDVLGSASDEQAADDADLESSGYEGPTGIVGVLADALHEADVPALSLWARLPHYVNKTPNSRGALALLQKLGRVLDLPLDLGDLESRAAEFDDEVNEAINSDPQLAAYVRELKRRAFSS